MFILNRLTLRSTRPAIVAVDRGLGPTLTVGPARTASVEGITRLYTIGPD